MSKICPKCKREQKDPHHVGCKPCGVPYVDESELVTTFTNDELKRIASFILKDWRVYVVAGIVLIAGVFALDWQVGKKIATQVENLQNTASNKIAQAYSKAMDGMSNKFNVFAQDASNQIAAATSAVTTQIVLEFQTRRIKQTVENVARNVTGELITNSLNPQVLAFHNEVDSRIKEIERSKDRVIALENKFATSRAEIQSAYDALAGEMEVFSQSCDARLGDRAAYLTLQKTSEVDTGKVGKVAKSLFTDLQLFYDRYKTSPIEPRNYTVNSVSKTAWRCHAELLYIGMLYHQDKGQRLASVEDTGKRGLKYLVQDLVSVVSNDSNLLVSSRAVAAIESLTGEKFGSSPPFSDVSKWWQESGCTNAIYTNCLNKVLTKELGIISPVDADASLKFLTEVISNKVGMCHIRTYIAGIYLQKNDEEKAKEQLKIVDEECDAQLEASLMYAQIFARHGEMKQSVGILKKVLPYVTSVSNFEKTIKALPAFSSAITNQEFQSLFAVKK
jgi:hypothetical protein